MKYSPAPQIEETPDEKKGKTKALLLTLLGAIYAISPFDIIPDIPVIGWIDDFFVLSAALLNLLEHYTGRTHYTLRRGLKIAKWVIVIVGIIVVAVMIVLGYFIFKWAVEYYQGW